MSGKGSESLLSLLAFRIHVYVFPYWGTSKETHVHVHRETFDVYVGISLGMWFQLVGIFMERTGQDLARRVHEVTVLPNETDQCVIQMEQRPQSVTVSDELKPIFTPPPQVVLHRNWNG